MLMSLITIIRSQLDGNTKNMAIGSICLLVMVFVLEGCFMFTARSFSIPYPLADQNWMRSYWYPTLNSQGYRDIELADGNRSGQKNILVLGSSYTAGDGIEQVNDRFSNILASQLSTGYRVYNLGKCGTDAAGQFRNLEDFPVRPDILIWCHTTKSIARPKRRPSDSSVPDIRPSFLMERSYLLNYIYWKFYVPAKYYSRHIEDIDNQHLFYYLDEGLLHNHFSEIDKTLDWCAMDSIPVMAVLFPAMNFGIGITEVIVNKPVGDHFRSRGVIVTDVYDLIKDLSADQRIVNSNNPHPGEVVHELLGNELYNVLTANSLISE